MSDTKEDVANKAQKDISTSNNDIMKFLMQNKCDTERLLVQQEARLSLQISANQEQTVQLVSAEIAKANDLLSQELSSKVENLRGEHSARLQFMHDDVSNLKAAQANHVWYPVY